ncbi:MAG TPA: GNAT family N-acetyltransferase [Actinomycetota bacterium]|jgi:predicted N-acetyltransferase YhbS
MAVTRDAGRAAVSVREARAADHPAVSVLLDAAYRQYEPMMPPGGMEYYLDDLLDLDSRAGTSQLLVAEVGGRLAGTVTFFPDAAVEGLGWPHGWAGLRALGVAPALRGRGVGRRLMGECVDRARLLGVPVLCLHTAAFMTAAVALYEAMGFRRAPAYDFDPRDLIGGEAAGSITVIGYTLDL